MNKAFCLSRIGRASKNLIGVCHVRKSIFSEDGGLKEFVIIVDFHEESCPQVFLHLFLIQYAAIVCPYHRAIVDCILGAARD